MTPLDPQLHEYGQELTRALQLKRRARQALQSELLDHMQGRYHDLRAEGRDHEAALAVVLREFGEAVHLADRINTWQNDLDREFGSRRHLGRWALALVGTAATLILLTTHGLRQPISWLDEPAPFYTVDSSSKFPLPRTPLGKDATMRTSSLIAGTLGWTLAAAAGLADAAVPTAINHQGIVAVNGQRYTGSALFKFAVVNTANGQNLWTHDNTEIGTTNAPAGTVSLTVNDGVYSVALGDTSVTGMTSALPAGTFASDATALRVWFNDGSHGLQQLTPDHKLNAVPYALRAETVSPAAINTAALADNAVTAAKLASDAGALTKVSGGTVVNTSGNIGVGTASPTGKLDVAGTVYVGDVLTMKARDLQNQYGGNIALSGGGTPGFDGWSIDVSGQFLRIGSWANWSDANLHIRSSDGYMGVGTWQPTEKLQVAGNIKCVSLIQTSSRSAKTDIQPLDGTQAMIALSQLQPVSYKFKNMDGRTQLGFIAEDVPEMVATPDRQSLCPMDIVAVLTKALQEQQATIEQQQKAITSLQTRVEQLSTPVSKP